MGLTNVSFPEQKRELLHDAVEHYRFESIAAFFRICGLILIEHYKNKDQLSIPLSFRGPDVNGDQTKH